MSRGPQPQSISARVRAVMPGDFAELRTRLPDLTSKQITSALQSGLTAGTVAQRGFVYEVVAPRGRPRMNAAEEDRPDTVLGHGSTHAPTHRPDPSQSPKVYCPEARDAIPLSSCLDDYTTAAAGLGKCRSECARCLYGYDRRAALAAGGKVSFDEITRDAMEGRR